MIEVSVNSAYKLLAPRLAVLITTVDKNGKINCAPYSFVMPVSMSPPLVSFASNRTHDTYLNIKETKEFVLNVPPEGIIEKVWICGKSFAKGVNELEEAGLTAKESKLVKPPGIEECIACLECRLEWIKRAGDHDIIVGEIVRVVAKEGLFDEVLDVEKAKTLLHVSGKKFVIGNHVKEVE